MARSTAKIALGSDLEKAREKLARNFGALRQDLDVGTHFKHSFHENKAAYIGGATLFGLLLAKLPARRKKIFVERKGAKAGVKAAEKAGIWLILLDFLFKTFRPALTSLVTKQVTEFIRSRGRSGE